MGGGAVELMMGFVCMDQSTLIGIIALSNDTIDRVQHLHDGTRGGVRLGACSPIWQPKQVRSVSWGREVGGGECSPCCSGSSALSR